MVIFISQSFAQESPKQEEYSNKLQFYLVNGLDIAYSDFSANLPLRYNMSITGFYNDNENEESLNRFYTTDTLTSNQNYNNKGFDYKLSAKVQYMIPVYCKNSFKSYFGFGPTVSFRRAHYNYGSEYENIDSEDISKSNNDQWSNYYGIGLSSVFGIEVVLLKHLALFAEYDLNYSYSWSNGKRKSSYDSSSSVGDLEGTGYNFSLNSVKLGVSVYF